MIKVFVLVISTIVLLSACSNQSTNNDAGEVTPESLKTSIQNIDDSLKGLYDQMMENPSFNIDSGVYMEAIRRNKAFYESFPEDAFAEMALNKIASLYFQLNMDEEALKWRAVILEEYPEAKNRMSLLELQMSHYSSDENFSQEKIEYYANELLKIEGLSDEKKEEYEFRLAHSDKTFSELIEYQILHSEED